MPDIKDNASMKLGVVLLFLTCAMGVTPVTRAQDVHRAVLTIHGRGDYSPHKPLTVSKAPWTLAWSVDCAGVPQKFAVIQIKRWRRPEIVADLIRVEATGQYPARYTGFKDK